jgi:hypothetical protein
MFNGDEIYIYLYVYIYIYIYILAEKCNRTRLLGGNRYTHIWEDNTNNLV